jgi:hypothetical protein
MKRNAQRSSLLVLSAASFLTPAIVLSQGTFVNLDFESANVPFVPAGQAGQDVTVAQGLPGWTAYLGGNVIAQIGHNDLSLGGAYISIQGPQWNSAQILQGNYTVFLESRIYGAGLGPQKAAIGQTGLIPAAAQSLRFVESAGEGPLQVTFNGQLVPLVALVFGANRTTYGGDISAFAGQTGELRFTSPESLPTGQGAALLDAITFSGLPVPEPGVSSLVISGLALLGLHGRWRAISRRR